MDKVKAIPEGYHSISTLFCVKGAAEFIDFCKKAFGAEEKMRMPGPNNSVMHAELRVGDSTIMVTDAINDAPTTSAVHFYATDCDTLYKNAVAAGAKGVMPVQQMFWGDKFGRLEDKWGNRWAVATHVEDVSPAELQKRMAAQTPKA